MALHARGKPCSPLYSPDDDGMPTQMDCGDRDRSIGSNLDRCLDLESGGLHLAGPALRQDANAYIRVSTG